jgi:chromosomal replication initiation ATPase DnaA
MTTTIHPTAAPHPLVARAAQVCGVTLDALRGPSREPHLVHARWLAMIALRRRYAMGLRAIAHQVGRSDHTTVRHGLTQGQRLAETAAWFKALLDEVQYGT